MTATVSILYPVRRGDRVSIDGACGYVLDLIRKPGCALLARVPADDGITHVVPVDRLRMGPQDPTAC